MSEYRVWECQICGWIYDEAQGWPEDGIAPGTRWDEIPEDWSCPDCGAAKQDFAMQEVAAGGPAKPAVPGELPPPIPQAQTANTAAQPTPLGNRIWECMVCGWVYDESQGWPEDGIAPGTRWEDIPRDWCCPQCGVSKDDFDMVLVEEPVPQAAEQAAPTGEPLVIIGSGLAGYNLAREFRKLDTSTPLLLISADDGGFYSKPLLSASLAHGKTPQQLVTASAEEMARELNAEILVHTQVTAIDPTARLLTLVPASGGGQAELHYGKLVLATGASCRPLPPIAGNGLECLFRVNSLADYRRFRTALAGTGGRKRVLLLGGGLIGCEFANDLIQSGFEVDVVDPLAWPLASLLPETAGRDLQRSLEAAGVRFHCNTRLKSLSRKGAGTPVTAELNNGEILTTDIALAALGLVPNTVLAETAGLAIRRGIAVDRRLQTSDPNIYALGDCAEVDDHLLYFVAPLVSCARALAKTLAGTPTEVLYGAIPVAVKTTLRPTTICPPAPGAEGDWHISASESGVQAEFRSGDGRLLGFALTGNAIAAREALTGACAPIMEE